MGSIANPLKLGASTANENTPLLIPNGHAPTTQTATDDATAPGIRTEDGGDEKPLPKMQIFLLCYCRLVDPIAFFSIFPFVNKMILDTGDVIEEDVGFYSGLIESLFSLTQMVMMIPWGRAADKYGRKPILVSSLCGVAAATACFGLSTKIWQMILFRCLSGVFAGSVVTIRSMISEHSTAKTQARAFSWFAFTNNLGIFLGPLIGGGLSEPATQYPSVFGRIQFLKDFPYALPTFIAGLIGLSTAIISAFFVTETLTPELRASNKTSPDASLTTLELVKKPGVFAVVALYGYTMLLGVAYTAVIPVFWFTEVDIGGMGFSPLVISLFMGGNGLAQAIWILLVFPKLQHRIGSGAVLRLCANVWPFMFVLWPIANVLLKHHAYPVFWTMVPLGSFVGSGVSMAFTGVQLALNDIAPSHATLGTLNALALAVVAGIRAIAPTLFSSLFAIGVKRQILSGYLVWVILIASAVGYRVALRWLPAKAEDKLPKTTSEDDE